MAYLSTTDFTQDKDFIDKWLYTIRTGEMDLSWMKSATEKISPEEANPRRGLTYRDLNVGTYGYTDILAVPHSLLVHDEIMESLSQFNPIEPSNFMA